MANARIGIDLGGTKIEGIALVDRGTVLLRQRVPTPKDNYQDVLQAIATLVTSIEKEIDATCTVGVGTPGAISPATGLIKNSNSTCLNGKPLAKDLSRLLERPLRFGNDANCLALSEATDGNAAGVNVVFGVILGTGAGGGAIVDGRPIMGINAIGGEWGHNPLPWPQTDELPGPNCYCGKQGCIETFLSGPGLTRDYESLTGTQLKAEAIVVPAEEGDVTAETVLTRYEDRLARGLATVINVLDPDVIVLGGGMSNTERLYDHVPRCWGRYVFSDRVDTKLVKPMHGDSSGVRGAAWLWDNPPSLR